MHSLHLLAVNEMIFKFVFLAAILVSFNIHFCTERTQLPRLLSREASTGVNAGVSDDLAPLVDS